jgi:hypothetical protein
MRESRLLSLRLFLLILLLLLPAACGRGTGTGESHTVWITAIAVPTPHTPVACFIDLTIVREGAAAVFADSVQAPYSRWFTARSGDLIYTDVKWAVPRTGTLRLRVTVDGELILDRDSIYAREALVISFWVP